MANNNELSLPFASRRSFLSLSAAASAAVAFRIVTEPMLAHARVLSFPKDAIRIDANENPLGPSTSPREAASAIVPQAGRYSDWLTMDLVKGGKAVILLRTFSKVCGMAGLRWGAALRRPDLLEKIEHYGGWNFMPITALAAASASLKGAELVPERKRINARIRGEVFAWLDHNGYSYVPSESNCFMLDTKRPAKAAIDAMAKQNIFIGRIWPAWPTYARITIGTASEMEQFHAAWQKVMSGAVTARVGATPSMGELGRRKRNLDENVIRG